MRLPGPARLLMPVLLVLFGLLTNVWAGEALEAAPVAGAVAHIDSTTATPPLTYWGRMPARADSVSAVFVNRPRPGWETAVMVPYFVAGLPFRLLYTIGDGLVTQLDDWGLFALPPAPHLGLLIPFDIYLMPEFGVDGTEGVTYGFNAARYELFDPDDFVFFTARTSTRHADKIAGGLYLELSDRTRFQLGGGSAEWPFTEFYGLGPESHGDDMSYYNRKSRWAGVELDRVLSDRTTVKCLTYFSRVETVPSGFETHLGLSQIHPDYASFGFPGQSNGWTFQLGLQHDTTDETARPERGMFKEASVSYFYGTDPQRLRFLKYRVNLEQYLPLWHTKRTLALRVFFNKIDSLTDEKVPMPRLLAFSHPDHLRGYSSLRFYGMGSLAFSMDYRWPIWVSKGRDGPGLDAYLFTDIGQVFNDLDDIDFDDLEVTGGFGVRFLGGDGHFFARAEIGLSDEEPVYRLKFSQDFQYARKGLALGKDPTRKP